MASADISCVSPPADGENSMSAGEFVLKKLFAEFVTLSDRKLQDIASQPSDYQLAKALQKGEDAHFDQLLNSLNEVASFCLRSILTSIFKWRDMQIQQCRSHTSWASIPSGESVDVSKREKDYLVERQELAIDFIFCLVLIEVLTKLSVHPVPESFIHTIEDYAFKHFKQQESLKERVATNPNIQSMKKIADLYAEVIGVLSQSRFHSVRKRFFHEIRDPQNNSSTTISIIEGMSFMRVKMFPVEELEQWFAFLLDCATFFLETSREKIKQAMCALLVEILLPVGAVIKVEASLPVARKFVTALYTPCFESAKRGKHSTAYIPLVTVLLAISETQFFLTHWGNFLMQIIVHNIKRGDSKVQRTALESLNRLVWVYMVRIKGESNTATVSKLKTIQELLFPKGQRGIQPKDMPLNIFVKLIHFISRERLEYGMAEILDLLNHGRTKISINPERMNIALRAFLVIADSLEKKEGDPPMPLNVGPLPSGGPQRVKGKFLSTTLTDETARKIGVKEYYPKIRSALDGMLKALDQQVGKTLVSTNPQNVSRPEEEVLGPVKPKLDLLKTCVAAIPRIMPADMTRDDLLEMLSHFTIHLDTELVRTAFNSLQNIITNFPGWRHHVTKIFALFILRDIPDSCPLVLESALKMLVQMVSHWKTLLGSDITSPSSSATCSPLKSTRGAKGVGDPSASSPKTGGGGAGGDNSSMISSNSTITASPGENKSRGAKASNSAGSGGGSGSGSGSTAEGGEGGGEMYYCLPWVEACALVTMCSYRSVTRRLSLVLLKEIRSLHTALEIESEQAACTVMDVVEKAMPNIVKRYLATLTFKERSELRQTHQSLNIYWMADRTSCFLEQGGSRDSLRDAWAQCLAGLLEPHLLPEVCPTAIHIAWPYAYQRMCKAYAILDPGFVAHEKGDRPPSLKGRRPVMSTVEMFLWRNYLIFLSCTAPPSTSLQASLMSSGDSTVLEGGGRNQLELNARNLFYKVVPFIRMDGEIREVCITALGMVHPNAFGDLVAELHTVIHDALDQRKENNPRKRRRREVLRVQITRVFALTAEHGCFQQSPMTRTEKGDVTTVFLEFIEGIKNCLEAESDRVMPYLQDLRLYFAAFISNIINSLPQGRERSRLFTTEMRYSLFYVFANWCDLFTIIMTDSDQELRRSRYTHLSVNALMAMSALLCCGTVFHPKCLDKDSRIFRWLENMLSSDEPKVQTLARKTVQMLLQNNVNATLLGWVVDRCYDSKPICAQLCFHALCNTITSNPKYLCDMITILHLVLYKTSDPEHTTRERAIHLLQILDRRYFTVGAEGLEGRKELQGCLKGGAYSQNHVELSKELALANPELTLPMFCEMVVRFEMSSTSGKRGLLQYMVPWLENVELVDLQPQVVIVHTRNTMPEDGVRRASGNPALSGTGWGSMEATKVVLHNLLYITTKYGDDYSAEVERLWSALCMWRHNIRVTINYLARRIHMVANVPLMLAQAKRIAVSFSRSQSACVVNELINDLNSVDLISPDLSSDHTPSLVSPQGTRRYDRPSQDGVGVLENVGPLPEGMEGTEWAVLWRMTVRQVESGAVPLPMPSTQYYVSMKDLFKTRASPQQQAPFHRCNFALILLSELVMELQDVDWSCFLPLLLHTILLGLDWFRPIVYEHSRKLLGSLITVLACRNDKMAALQARFLQQELFLRSPSYSMMGGDTDHSHSFTARMLHTFSDDSLHPTHELFQNSLLPEAKELINFVSSQETHRPPWPFTELNANRSLASGDVQELSTLVGKMLTVFQNVSATQLKESWANTALLWATTCSSHQYASQSFQVCRALQLPLSPQMFRDVLTRLAESVSEEKDDMQSYVFEIVLTLECAVDHSDMELEDEEDGPHKMPLQQRSSLPTSQSHSQLQSYDTSFLQQQHQQLQQQQKQQQQLQQQQQQQLQQQQQQQAVKQPPSISLASPSTNPATHLTRKHSDVPPLPSEMPDGRVSYSPAPDSGPDTSTPAASNNTTLGGITKRKHSRGRSVTSKAEMMGGRPNSAKARVDYVPTPSNNQAGAGGSGSTVGGAKTSSSTAPGSPLAVKATVTSPTHHKTATVIGAGMEQEFGGSRNSPHHRSQPRPHSTHFGNTNAILPISQPIPSAASASSFTNFIDNSIPSAPSQTTSTPATPSSLPATSLPGSTADKDSKNKVSSSVNNNNTGSAGVNNNNASGYPINNDVGKPSSSSAAASPLKSEAPPSMLNIENGVNTTATVVSPSDVVAPPSSATPPDGKPSRESKDVTGRTTKESQPAAAAGNNQTNTDKEKETNRIGIRKASEPPPSLQALFTRGESMGSSRRWSTRQFSAEELHSSVHPKQHSLDSTYSQSIMPQSPKYRRVKSPSVSDKNAPPPLTPTRMEPSGISTTSVTAASVSTTNPGSPLLSSSNSSAATLGEVSTEERLLKRKDSGGSGNALRRTPSHPYLNSGNSSPHIAREVASITPDTSHPIVRAHSTQQLKITDDSSEDSSSVQLNQNQQQQQHQLGRSVWSKAGSHSDLSSSDLRERSTTPLGLKLLKDREISQSKESLDQSLEFGMKRMGSKESLKIKEISRSVGVQPSPAQKDSGVSPAMSLPVHLATTPKDGNWERSTALKDTQASAEGSVENMQATFTQGSPPKHDSFAKMTSLHSLQVLKRLPQSNKSGKKARPSSMIEMSSLPTSYPFNSADQSQAQVNPGPPELLAQLFWTGASLLESDFPSEYTMALRLLTKAFEHLDLTLNDSYVSLEKLLDKMEWNAFPGVQKLLLKGLTHDTTSEPTRELLSKVTLFSTRPVFDPTRYAGLPLNVMALMPFLVHHFDQPTPFCAKVVSNIQQACMSVDLPGEEDKTKMGHMSKMFQMYSTRDFNNGCDLWLAGICRYLNDVYTPLAVKILSLLSEMLEKGVALYHQPVLKLLYEYLKLQDPDRPEIKKISDLIMTIAIQHIRGHLWKEVLSLLTLAVSNSSSLVQPPTRGLPVDLGLFNQTLPGPTLQFSMDLRRGSSDLDLATPTIVNSSWKQPQGSQRRTRERLASVLNASGPGLGLMSSPSVVFTDDQALLADKGTLYSSTSDEAASSITSINHEEAVENSQPESQSYINAQFNFLDNLEYMYEPSSSEGETPGPFTRSSFQTLEVEEKEEDSSPQPSLGGSRVSLVDTEEFGDHGKVVSSPRFITPEPSEVSSPDRSPDFPMRHRGDIHRPSPDKSPIVIRKYTKSPDLILRPGLMRSPDLRMRSTLDNVHSLPLLKEGSPETSADDDLQVTPKQSPERDMEQPVNRVPPAELQEGSSEGNKERDNGGEGNTQGSLHSLSSVNLPLSHEGSPERKLTLQEQSASKGDRVQSGVVKSPSSPRQDMEPSYDRSSSKVSDDTLSVHSNDLVFVHSKSPSEVSGGGAGPAGSGKTVSTRDLSRVISSSSPLSVAHLATHSKAASDDMTVMSTSSKHLVVAPSKLSSKSLTGINTIGMRPGEAFEALKRATLLEQGTESQENLLKSPPQEPNPGGTEPDGGTESIEPHQVITGPTRAPDEDTETSKEPVDRGLEPNREARPAGPDDSVAVGGAVSSDGDPTNLGETVISPTLKIREEQELLEADGEKKGIKEQPVGDDVLFEMLKEKESQELEKQKKEDAARDETMTSGAAQEDEERDKEEVVEDDEFNAGVILDEFDKMLEMEETASVVSSGTDGCDKDMEIRAPAANKVEEQQDGSLTMADNQQFVAEKDGEKLPPSHPNLHKLEESSEADSALGEPSVNAISPSKSAEEENGELDFRKEQNDSKSEPHAVKEDGSEEDLHSLRVQGSSSPSSSDLHKPGESGLEEVTERMSASEEDDSPDKGSSDGDQEKEEDEVRDEPGLQEEDEEEEEKLVIEGGAKELEREVSEEMEDHSRQTSEEPQESMLETSSEWIEIEAPQRRKQPIASRFINFDIDEVEDMWQAHVIKLSQEMQPKVAIHTYFLFGRLFLMVKGQFCNLTREACNYLEEEFKTIASHFLVTTEFLYGQFQLPKIYIDEEMVKTSGILEQHVFIVMELHGALSTYMDRRQSVLKSLAEFKLALRQESSGSSPHPVVGPLDLCKTIHKFHFQLLVLLGSYVKLLALLEKPLQTSPLLEMCGELSKLTQGCSDAVQTLSRSSSPPLDGPSYYEVDQLSSLPEAVSSMEDSLSQHQYFKAVQILRVARKQWKGEKEFGTLEEEDDVDCLFFIYARYLSDRQEGVLCVAGMEHKLSEVHARLMAQNISLHSLLESRPLRQQ